MPDAEKMIPVFIEDEMKKSYLDYSMSMITSRALPDVRDGVKPVHRRVLYGMHDSGMQHNKPTKKCANVVGHVMAKYHPHGDHPIYETLVRMAQDFSLRYPMVEGQGNFGSIDGDPPAAYRYTECRMTRLAEEMLADIDKETVDFVSNYDDTSREPSVLPAKLPFLLINGSTGIAVGMATNMAPHNLGEVVDAVVATIENPEIELPELIKLVPGPDFPTGGLIYGRSGIVDAYRTGRGRVVMRARAAIEQLPGDREQIVITEIPYMVNKATMLQRAGELIRDKVIEGVSLLRDESDRKGLRIVVGIKKGAYAEIVLNKLYKYTQLQSTFGINNLALVGLRPRLLTLKEIIELFIEHRFSVVTRRTEHDLRKARERAHLLEGLKIAVDNIDEVVSLIKTSASTDEAHGRLRQRFSLSDAQAKAILDMRLQRLTGLEREKIESELRELVELIRSLEALLESREQRMNVIKEELLELKKRYGDPRRTEIVEAESDVELEDMIADEDMVVTMTHEGYVKRCSVSSYRSQGRGGRGIKGMGSREGDFVQTLFVASAHTHILFFTNTGRCYRLKVYLIPEAPRNSRGRPIVNLLQLRPEESIVTFLTVKDFDSPFYIVAATARGIINKQPLKLYANVRRDGINAFNLDERDRVISCRLTDGSSDIILGTRKGQAVRFHESATRELGRNTRGMKGVSLRGDDHVVSMIAVREEDEVLTITENGYGKRTPVREYRKTNRGGFGIINIKCTERNGEVVALKGIGEETDVMLITRNGIIIRSDAQSISVVGRNTQGVRVMNLNEEDHVIDIALCAKETVVEDVESEQEGDSADETPEDPASRPGSAEEPAPPNDDDTV